MKTINPEFNSTDALLLYSIAYCQHHNEKVTLSRLLLTTDAINRSYPTVHDLEEGLSRLIVNKYVEVQKELFTVTETGFSLFNDIIKLQNPKVNMFEQIRNLTDKLNVSLVKNVSKQITITDDQVSKAIKETLVIFNEISEKADNIKGKTL